MTSEPAGRGRIVGTLRSADGVGIVRIEDRIQADIDDLWSALTDPDRLAHWYGEVKGDLARAGPSASTSSQMTGRAPAASKHASHPAGYG